MRRASGTRTAGRACTGKRRYETRHHAERALDYCVSRGAAPSQISVYQCPIKGDHYHVGHRPGSRGKR